MAVHFGGRGPGHMARVLASTSTPSGPAYQSESYPATITLVRNIGSTGDSIAVGVGTLSPYSFPEQFDALSSGATITRSEGAGTGYTPGVVTTPSVTTRFTSQSASLRSSGDLFTEGFVNDIDPSQNSSGYATAGDDLVSIFGSTIVPSMSGDALNNWTYFVGPMTDSGGPGQTRWAQAQKMRDDMAALYGSHVFDIRRFLQWHGRTTDTADLDYVSMREYGTAPLTYRGISSTLFADTVETEADIVFVNTATNTAAGVEAAAPAAGYSEGTIAINRNAAAINGGMFRKGAGGAWVTIDTKHFSRWGYAAFADAMLRITHGRNGTLAYAFPQNLFLKQDAAAATSAGIVSYVGPAPDSIGIFDPVSLAPVTTLTATDNGSTNNNGSITVSRSSSGTLVEGEQELLLQLVFGSHVLHTPLDLRVGQPSTQTTPRMWTIPSTGFGTTSTDFSGAGSENHGFVDGGLWSFAGWVMPSDLTGGGTLISCDPVSGNGRLELGITSDGRLALPSWRNSASTLVVNNNGGPTSGGGPAFAVGVKTWFAVEVDVTGPTVVINGYFNKGGAGDTLFTWTGLLTGNTTIPGQKFQPIIFSRKPALFANRYWTTLDSGRSQYRGAFGNLIMLQGLINPADSAVRRSLWNTDGTPVDRVPYAAINGIVPGIDIQGGPGDFARGGFDQAHRYYFTPRGINGLVAA